MITIPPVFSLNQIYRNKRQAQGIETAQQTLQSTWSKAHGITLMVHDLTNPMLAQIPHVLLATLTGTIMGVETNALQFYPDHHWQRRRCIPVSTGVGMGASIYPR
jgi:hypothetical protein